MNLFIDKNHRRKSPLPLQAFSHAAGPLHLRGSVYPAGRAAVPAAYAAQHCSHHAVHTLIIALAGTAIGSLLFLLRDKRVALFGFVGLAVVLVMFYFAAWMLDTDQRATMVQLITLYGVAPA